MNIKKMKSAAESICFKSANETIEVRITSLNGPELTLEDNSKIIFTSVQQYYKLIGFPDICNPTTKEFNLEKFRNLYFDCSDDVVDIEYRNERLYNVELYVYENSLIYRFIM